MAETTNRKLWIPTVGPAEMDGYAHPLPHHETHEDGGSDEVNVGGLDGILKEPQVPIQARVLRLISIRI